MNKTLSVAAIQHGTVIDHIAAGQALRIIRLLGLLDKKYQVTVGLNLPSKRFKLKDLIKVENHILTYDEANEVTVFAPQATINVIRDFEVVNKIITSLPTHIQGVFSCPNAACVTHAELTQSAFHIEAQGEHIKLICQFCEKIFDRNQALLSAFKL
jgi:aspartate carbamoyltransferase regulatory subunit